MIRYAILFPGQGSQTVGMAGDLLTARPDLLGSRADELLGWDLEATITDGPEEVLTSTDRAQPALYAVSYALWEEFRAAVTVPPRAAAGHSLGEYTALTAAGVVDYWEGLRLVAARGAAMSHAANAEPSGMAALVGADLDSAEVISAARNAEGGRLSVANINAPGQVVVAGGAEDIAWLGEHADQFGLRRVVPLKVAGAFHSPFMHAAADELADAVAATTFTAPQFPVYANATARPVTDPGATLVEQLVSPVRFAESLQNMAADGIDAFVHIGPGDVTAGLARRTVSGAQVVVVSSIDSIDAAAAELSIQ